MGRGGSIPPRIWVVDDDVAASSWERELVPRRGPGRRGARRQRRRGRVAAHAAESADAGRRSCSCAISRTARRLVEGGASVADVQRRRAALRARQGQGQRLRLPRRRPIAPTRARCSRAASALEVQDVPASRPQTLRGSGPGARLRDAAAARYLCSRGGLAALDATPVAQTLLSQPLVTATILGLLWGDSAHGRSRWAWCCRSSPRARCRSARARPRTTPSAAWPARASRWRSRTRAPFEHVARGGRAGRRHRSACWPRPRAYR